MSKFIKQITFYKYRLVMLLLIVFSIALSLSLIFASTPFNPIQDKLKFVKTIFNITPQGWAFFTKDAREEQLYIYKITDGKLCKINQKHANFENLVGLSRHVSKLAVEVETMTGKINRNSLATPTKWNYDSNIIGQIPKRALTVQNTIKNPILCGDYLLVYQEIAPWAWSSSRKTLKMPAKALKLKIVCQK